MEPSGATSMNIHTFRADGDEDVFHAVIERVEKVKKADEIDGILWEAKRVYGLKNVAYAGFNIPKIRSKIPYVAVTYDKEWVQHYVESAYFEIDPVVQRGLRSILPLDWTLIDRTNPKVKQFFDEALEAGVGANGISIPVRGRNGEIALFTITSDLTPTDWHYFKQQFMRDFQVLALHIHQTILRANNAEQPEIRLSAREIECLYWASCGKTSEETAIILGLSKRGVRFHIDNVLFKLNAVNIAQAVGKAVALELIKSTL